MLKYYIFLISIMKFRNQARICLAVFDFEAHIMLSLCLTFQAPEFLVLFTNAYSCSGLIKSKEVQFMMEIKAGVMLSICLIFHQKSG